MYVCMHVMHVMHLCMYVCMYVVCRMGGLTPPADIKAPFPDSLLLQALWGGVAAAPPTPPSWLLGRIFVVETALLTKPKQAKDC